MVPVSWPGRLKTVWVADVQYLQSDAGLDGDHSSWSLERERFDRVLSRDSTLKVTRPCAQFSRVFSWQVWSLPAAAAAAATSGPQDLKDRRDPPAPRARKGLRGHKGRRGSKARPVFRSRASRRTALRSAPCSGVLAARARTRASRR